MGDWAESLRDPAVNLAVSHYGASDNIQAGDPGFKEFYLAQNEEVRVRGKRPDLLLFDSGSAVPSSITAMASAAREAHAQPAVASIEVRSSKYHALQYAATKSKRNRKSGQVLDSDHLSFTVKVEDLAILYRWLEQHPVPQAYFQVFFDSAYGINVLSILQYIASSPKGINLKNPEASQGKATIFLPITWGVRIGTMTEPPEFNARWRTTALGRVDAYVQPVGGRLVLDRDAVDRVLFGGPRGQGVHQG